MFITWSLSPLRISYTNYDFLIERMGWYCCSLSHCPQEQTTFIVHCTQCSSRESRYLQLPGYVRSTTSGAVFELRSTIKQLRPFRTNYSLSFGGYSIA